MIYSVLSVGYSSSRLLIGLFIWMSCRYRGKWVSMVKYWEENFGILELSGVLCYVGMMCCW